MLHAIAEVDSNEDHSLRQSAPQELSSDGSLSGEAGPICSAPPHATPCDPEGSVPASAGTKAGGLTAACARRGRPKVGCKHALGARQRRRRLAA
jgi:hypothetical protein